MHQICIRKLFNKLHNYLILDIADTIDSWNTVAPKEALKKSKK